MHEDGSRAAITYIMLKLKCGNADPKEQLYYLVLFIVYEMSQFVKNSVKNLPRMPVIFSPAISIIVRFMWALEGHGNFVAHHVM